ncbi:MAG: MTAP family purine nucleoside phosphorylase [Bacteriovoracaceae bacterium]|nr:MTAP family purine nucleoside phosphorylase [Bacteriovoracaceae bacterium]
MWAIIGGSGFESFDDFEVIEDLNRNTPFGQASSGLKKVKLGSTEILFLPRHGSNHELTPSGINYQANIYTLKKHGATKILSVSAVGSLRQELKPGDMVVPTQYIDRTKSLRKHTFCENGVVGHVSLAYPVSNILTEALQSTAGDMDFDIHFNKTYVCMEGPGFSTFAESQMYRQLGADIIGMTNFPEYGLAKEAGLAYLPCSFVTDYDCWNVDAGHVTVAEVIAIMKKNNGKAFKMATNLLNKFSDIDVSYVLEDGLKNALMSPIKTMSQTQQEWVKILIGE